MVILPRPWIDFCRIVETLIRSGMKNPITDTQHRGKPLPVDGSL